MSKEKVEDMLFISTQKENPAVNIQDLDSKQSESDLLEGELYSILSGYKKTNLNNFSLLHCDNIKHEILRHNIPTKEEKKNKGKSRQTDFYFMTPEYSNKSGGGNSPYRSVCIESPNQLRSNE
jgi:hypothetical protein